MDKRAIAAFLRSSPSVDLKIVGLAYAEFKDKWLDRYRREEIGEDAWGHHDRPYEDNLYYTGLTMLLGTSKSWQRYIHKRYRAARRGRARHKTRDARALDGRDRRQERDAAYRKGELAVKHREAHESRVHLQLDRATQAILEATQRRARAQGSGKECQPGLRAERYLRGVLESNSPTRMLKVLATVDPEAHGRAKKEICLCAIRVRIKNPYEPPTDSD
jgi:hypothetical protein